MTITKEGSLASFYTVNKAPIKHLKVYFSPKQSGSGDPSPENVREINGWNGCQCIIGEKNLFDATTVNLITGMYRSDTGIETSTENSSYTANTYEINTNKILYIKPNDVTKIRIYFLDQNKNWISRTKQQSIVADWGYLQFNPANFPNNTKYIQIQCSINYDISKLIMCYGDDAIDINWTSSPGTVYGGYVDLITGELVQTHYKITLNDTVIPYQILQEGDCIRVMYSSTQNSKIQLAKLKAEQTINDGKYSHGSYTINNDMKINQAIVTSNTKGTATFAIIWLSGDINVSDLGNDVKSYIKNQYDNNTPIEIYYPLATPITNQLTPTQLQTFIGQNNIWSNADRVEVEYDLAESNDELYRRRNIILQSAPHLETISENMASFHTDIIAPLKDAKIYFNPIQEGIGVPNLNNIRNIHGWTSLNIATSPTNISLIPINFSSGTIDDGVINYLGNGMIEFIGDFREHQGASIDIPIQPFTFLNTTTYYISAIREPYSGLSNEPQAVNFAFRSNNSNKVIFRPNSYTWNNLISTVSLTPSQNTTIDTLRIGITQGSYNFKIQLLITTNTLTNISIPWINQDTIYGGYVDLINGKLIKEWNDKILNSSATLQTYGQLGSFLGAGFRFSQYKESLICDSLPIYYRGESLTNVELPFLYADIQPSYLDVYLMCCLSSDYPNVSGANIIPVVQDWIANNNISATLIYKRKTPIEYSLTPQTLKTLKGTNNIWSNTNGPVEISYWTH